LKSKRSPSITKREKEHAAYYVHNKLRSKKAQDVDNGTTRGVTDNFGAWWEDPMRHDLPGIDTMIRGVPLGYDSRKGKKAHDEIVSIFGVPKL